MGTVGPRPPANGQSEDMQLVGGEEVRAADLRARCPLPAPSAPDGLGDSASHLLTASYRSGGGGVGTMPRHHSRGSGVGEHRAAHHVDDAACNITYEVFHAPFCASSDGTLFLHASRDSTTPFDVFVDPISTAHIRVEPFDAIASSAPSSAQAGRRGRRILMHRDATMAVLALDPEAAYSIYHLMADTLVSWFLWAAALMSGPPEGATADVSSETIQAASDAGRRAALHTYLLWFTGAMKRRRVVVREDLAYAAPLRRPCRECSRVATVMEHQSVKDWDALPRGSKLDRSVLSPGFGAGPLRIGDVEQGSDLICFCSAVMVSRYALAPGATVLKGLGYQQLREHLPLRPLGSLFSSVEQDRRIVGLSPGQRDGGRTPPSSSTMPPPSTAVPLLGIIQRNGTRRIDAAVSIAEMARSIGFTVQLWYLEGLSAEAQVDLFATFDVVVLSHGMAMGWVHMMAAATNDHVGRSTASSCSRKTVVELQHRVRDFPLHYQFGALMAKDNGLAHELVRAMSCTFGPSVVDPVKEEALLMDARTPIQVAMTSPGFFDQVAVWAMSDIDAALRRAWLRWHRLSLGCD